MPDRAPLDARTGRPLYEQLRGSLREGVSRGQWKAGEAIPTEAALAAEYAVSIGTVRKAADALVAGGVLVRMQGIGGCDGWMTDTPFPGWRGVFFVSRLSVPPNS